MRSRRRIFIRRKAPPVRALGVLTLIFVGAFTASVITFDWSESPFAASTPGSARANLAGTPGFAERNPSTRLAASTSTAPRDHR